MKLRTKRLTIVLAVASAFIAMSANAQETAPVTNPTTNSDTQSPVQVAASGQAQVVDQAPDQSETPQPKLSGAAAASAAARQSGIQQVVVTATKRKEDASKVPISMTVIGGDELLAQHIGDYADITRSVPNISFSGAGGGGDAGDGPGLSNIEIRGVSSSAGAATVGLYLDDVSMTQPNSYSMGSPEPKFFDIDHVEVLRGPQGTLYGASSMGGTLKFITNQPDTKAESAEFYTELSQTQGANTPNYNGNVVLNKPLIPGELAIRFGVQAEHIGGYIDQVDSNANIIDKGINWQDNGVVKFAAKWTPTKDLTITPSIISQKVKTGDTDVSYTQLLVDAQPTGMSLPNYQTSKLTHEPGSDALTVPSLTINYSTDIGDLTSVSSFFKRDFTRVQDGQFTNSWQLANYYIAPDPTTGNLTPLANTIQGLPSAVTLSNYVTQFSQEVRMASKPYAVGGSPFTWIVGGYVSNGFTDVHENDFVYGVNHAFAVNGASPTAYPGVWNTPTSGANCNQVVCTGSAANVAEGFPNDNTWHGDFSYHDTQQSIFGESSYYFTPGLHATVGVRYLHAEQLHNSYQDLFYQGDTPTYTHNDVVSGDKVTPKFAVVWETSQTNSVFATAAEGFRLGGANSAVPWQLCGLSGPNPTGYTSDSLWSYEVGDKARFLNNTVTLNTSLFYVKWKNMQQEIELACSFDYNVNVGTATSYGGEFELKYKPISSVVIDAAGGYTHATLDNSDGANDGVAGAVQGAWIPGVPEYNFALTATYSYDITDDYFGFLRGGVHFIGSSYGGFSVLPNGAPDPDFNRPAYHTIDVSTGVSWKEWEATLFVKNLANNNMVIQRPVEQAQESGEVYLIPPRQIGVSLSAKF
jgi:outer membrane receptor protein involved in Fe transport